MAIDVISPSAGSLGSVGRPADAAAKTAPASASGFSDALAGLLASVDESAGAANNAVADMVQGTGDVHEAMIALQRAETTLQLTVQVRNKLVQAYQDVMRMPI
ncbi:MAG: flagellar hook-basal body complex protein FliE [Vicinamibacterales bacterium]